GQHLLKPSDLGFEKINPADIHGGNSIEESAEIFRNILNGKGTDHQNNTVCANAAMAIRVRKDFKLNFQECFEEAKESLFGGKARKSLEMICA
ncbi:MAG TPA: anthranilate phosphoribosyltransferase, partial [Bacteroidetes bacterium]|nr:anthranilate phosphoribosyltransferase [Bacteroidota bacterium]